MLPLTTSSVFVQHCLTQTQGATEETSCSCPLDSGSRLTLVWLHWSNRNFNYNRAGRNSADCFMDGGFFVIRFSLHHTFFLFLAVAVLAQPGLEPTSDTKLTCSWLCTSTEWKGSPHTHWSQSCNQVQMVDEDRHIRKYEGTTNKGRPRPDLDWRDWGTTEHHGPSCLPGDGHARSRGQCQQDGFRSRLSPVPLCLAGWHGSSQMSTLWPSASASHGKGDEGGRLQRENGYLRGVSS